MSLDTSIPAFTGTATRLTDTPLVAAGMFPPAVLAGLEPDALANINGPSVLRMPDWAAGKQAAFHMYFGHHKGKSLRLAYADRLEGPWAMYPDPVIPLADSLFEPEDPAPDPTLPEPDWVGALGGDYLYAHVASPDAHIDEPNRQIVMYYHGLLRDGDQQTRLATSTDGLHFTPQAPLLGPPYFRATRLDRVIYLSMWEGGDLPMQPSIMGTAKERLHELRDPALFTDNGQLYMAYCGGGESGIGIARVEGL